LAGQRSELLGIGADLIVDLAGSFKSGLLTFMAGARVLNYCKQPPGATPKQHAVDNFLATLKPLSLKRPGTIFPTLSPPQDQIEAVQGMLHAAGVGEQSLVGLVPGVGALRPHRAWISDGWSFLPQAVRDFEGCAPVLVGGPDETALCQAISEEAQGACVNLAGALSLVETASLLKLCRVVISGDTGPAHIAVGVGTSVIGLYGPTFPARSGPYGCDDLLVDHSADCQCHDLKMCDARGAPELGPGQCMRQLMLEEIMDRLSKVLGPPK
jgi:ADP-heptose:LPS heptosyltransferase